MKKTIQSFIFLSLFLNVHSFGQTGGVKSLTKTEADSVPNKVNKGINFGVSLGFNSVFENLYDAIISPIDNKVIITSLPKSSFLISTALSVPLTQGKLGGRYYRKLDDRGKQTGPVYYVPFGLCFVATVNLVTFNSAANGSIFNQQIDGGLGLGYRVNEDLQVALTYEMLSIRQPRDFVVNDYNGKVITVNSQPLTSLNQDDNNYFMAKYMPSISVKFIYLIRTSNTVKD